MAIMHIHWVRGEPGTAARTIGYPPDADTSTTFEIGAALTLQTDGEVAEFAGGTQATDLLGFAAEGSTASDPDGPADEVVVYIATDSTEFVGTLVNASSVVQTADAANVGVSYGLIKTTSGIWAVDESETTTPLVTITRIDDQNNLVFFKVINTARQMSIST